MKRYALVLSLVVLAGCSDPPKPKAEPVATPPPVVQAPPAAPAPSPQVKAPEPVAQKAAPRTPSKPAQSAKVTAPVPAPPAPPVAAVPPVHQPEPAPAPRTVASAPVFVPDPPEPVIRKIVIPAGTLVDVRMIDTINSASDHVGQSFKASLVSPIVVDNETVIPRNSDVYVKLASVKSAGNMGGTSELRVQLDRIFIGKKSYVVESNTFSQVGGSQTKTTARNIGIGTAIGAAIGAISGGKKGAVIGGAAGAGTGVAVEAATKGEQVRIESESALTFRLEAPIEVTLVKN